MGKRKWSEKDKPCVYFISDGEFVKIGVTGDINNRFRILQTANARKLKILNVIYTDSPYELEEELHKRYAWKRVNKEWFDILEMISDEEKVISEVSDKPISLEEETKYYTPADLERILRLSHGTVNKLLRVPGFPVLRVGDNIRIPCNAFNEYINTHRTINLNQGG